MILLQLSGLAVSILANFLASHFGNKSKSSMEVDLLFPFTSLLFMFYPLIVSLPEAHYKLINYSMDDSENAVEELDEDQIFPYAFLISLLSITASLLIDRFFLSKDQQQTHEEDSKGPLIKNKNALQFLLTLSITLQNVVNYYFICVEQNQAQALKQIFLFLLFSVLINYSHAYLLAKANLDQHMNTNLSIFMNSALLVGFLLSFIIEPDVALLVLPCVCAGLQIYCSIFVCFPNIFTNGQKPGEDKSRYCSIIIIFLLTVIYYPICYILRI